MYVCLCVTNVTNVNSENIEQHSYNTRLQAKKEIMKFKSKRKSLRKSKVKKSLRKSKRKSKR